MLKRTFLTTEADSQCDILARCLQSIEGGLTTIDVCVQQYSGYTELETLLSIAAALQKLAPVGMPLFYKKLLRQNVIVRYESQFEARRFSMVSRWQWLLMGVYALVLLPFITEIATNLRALIVGAPRFDIGLVLYLGTIYACCLVPVIWKVSPRMRHWYRYGVHKSV